MADPYCHECSMTTGGCMRHSIAGIYVIDERGLRKTYAPVKIKTQTGWFYYMGVIDPFPNG